jgi:hypothetical protein
MRKPSCDLCGSELACLEITNFGDSERKYVATEKCDCEGYCPLCDHQIEAGKCWNVDCVLAGKVAL